MDRATPDYPFRSSWLALLAALIALAPLAIDAYLPAFPAIATEFGVEPQRVNFTMSAYLIGMAIGQLLGGPLSDQIGRKRIGLLGLALFSLFTLLIPAVHSLSVMVGLRVLQAIGGGLASSVVMPTLRDLSAPDRVASRIALVFLIMLLAPLVAPVIGVVLLGLGWRWIFVFLALYAAVIGLLYAIRIPESRDGNSRRPDFGAIFGQYLSTIRHRLDGHRLPFRYSLATSFGSCIMLIYLTHSSFIFLTFYGIPPTYFPLLFAANVVCVAIVQSVSARYLKHRELPGVARYYRFGLRLQLGLMFVLVGVASLPEPPLWLFMLLLAGCLSTIGIVNPSGAGVTLAAYRKLSGSASAILTTSSFVLGALLGFLSALVTSHSLLPAALALLVASLIANLLLWSIPRAREEELLRRLGSGELQPL